MTEILDLKTLRKSTLIIAVEMYLKNKVIVFRAEIGNITFTKSGLKEAINQPFKMYYEKCEIIKYDLINHLQNGAYLGKIPNNKKSKPHIVYFHYIEIQIRDISSQIVITEDRFGVCTFYSITEKKETD